MNALIEIFQELFDGIQDMMSDPDLGFVFKTMGVLLIIQVNTVAIFVVFYIKFKFTVTVEHALEMIQDGT